MSDQKLFELVLFLGFFALFGGGMIFWLKWLFKRRREEVEALFRGQKILMQHNFAHFYGRQSLGHAQARGNGVLVLTAEQLYFLKALPRRETGIPLDSIVALSNPRSHLGKTNMAPLLRVDFVIDGRRDAIAWMVGDQFEAWTEAVQRARDALSRTDGEGK